MLLESFFSIWPVYNLFIAFAITTTIVYLSLAIGYLLLIVKSRYIITAAYEYNNSVETLKLFRYFPPFFAAILFAFCSGFNCSRSIIRLLSVAFILGGKLFVESKNAKSEFILTGRNLGLSKNEIYSKIIWKSVEPVVYKELSRVHYFLWIIIMIYEFIAEIEGFGGVYRIALLYNDFSALISIAIFISIIIWLGNVIIDVLGKKMFSWED
jgi:ABC-type nitrate/sulfonate/bicarbonate transport system permease component